MTETIPQPRTEVAADQIEDTAPESAKPGLLVLAPLRIEANAVRRGLTRPTSQVLRTGMGATRARKSAVKSQPHSFGAMVVMGTAAGLSDDLSPGDLVVATEVSDGETTVAAARRRPARGGAAPRRAATPARDGWSPCGKIVKASERVTACCRRLPRRRHGVGRPGRQPRAGGPVAVIRAVSDAGFGPGMVSGGMAALRSLRLAAPVAEKWAAACRERTVLLAGPRSFCAGRGAGHRDRGARARAARRPGLRAQADRAQHPGGLRPGAARRGVRRRARRGAGRRDGGVLRARRVARGARRRVRTAGCR